MSWLGPVGLWWQLAGKLSLYEPEAAMQLGWGTCRNVRGDADWPSLGTPHAAASLSPLCTSPVPPCSNGNSLTWQKCEYGDSLTWADAVDAELARRKIDTTKYK